MEFKTDKPSTVGDVEQHYEEILTSLDFTFGEIREAAEEILQYNTSPKVEKLAKNIIGLIESRRDY
mgnify:CR=1 FL=1